VNRSRRLRIIGTCILVCGVLGAALFFWNATRNAPPSLDDAAAGYTRSRERQMGQMMGTMGVATTRIMETLETPAAEAALIAFTAALVAALCFRIAKLMDLPPSHPAHWPQQ